MRPEADWRGTACLLRAGIRASFAGHVGAILAGLGILHQGMEAAYLTALAAWGYLVYLQIRVSLDAELFEWLANGATTAELDGFLVKSGLIRVGRERTADDRCKGALGLWRQLMAVMAVELIAVLIGLR
jgi:hypothetical protein